MRSCLVVIIALLAGSVLAQEQHRKIGAIEFFGSSGMDLQRIKTNLPTKEGDELAASDCPSRSESHGSVAHQSARLTA